MEVCLQWPVERVNNPTAVEKQAEHGTGVGTIIFSDISRGQ